MRLLPDSSSASDRIAERLAALGPLIAEMEEARGDALLRGEDWDAEKLAGLRREQADLESILAAATRRDRNAEAEALEAQRRQARRELRRHDETRLEAVAAAEKAALALVEALGAYREAMASINHEATRLGRRGLSAIEGEKRLTRRLAATFKPLVTVGRRFGHLDFPPPMMKHDETDTWREGEAAHEAAELSRILKD